MNNDIPHIGNFSGARRRDTPFLRGFIDGTAGLLDIFGAGAGWLKCGTPEDDARELHGDVEQIARDFYAVFASIESTSKK